MRSPDLSRRVVAVALTATLLLAAGLAMAGPSATADVLDVRQATGDGDLRLELLEQDLAVEADGTIRLVYRLSGDLAGTADLAPTTTTTTTSTTTTTAAAPPDITAPAADGDASATTTATTNGTGATTSATSTVPVPPPVPLTVEITNYRPASSTAELRDLIGSDVRRDAFDGNEVIDGVALTDVRDMITFDTDDAGRAILELTIPTDVRESVGEKLKFERAGLYPLRVELVVGDPGSADVVATAGTVVQRLPDADDVPPPGSVDSADGDAADGGTTPSVSTRLPPPIDLAVIAAIEPPGTDPAAQAAAEEQLDAAIELAGTVDAPLTLEVPPPLVAARTATDGGAERLAAAFADDEFVALPVAPLDVSSAVAVGREDAFARLLSAGADMLTEAVPTTPSRRDVWIAVDPLSAGGARELRELGVRLLVMSSDLYTETVSSVLPATDLFVEVSLPDGSTLPLLVVDGLADELTTDAADAVLTDATPTEWAIETLAVMLLEQEIDDADRTAASPRAGTARRSRLLTTPDLGAPDPRLVGVLERVAATTPSVDITPASSLTGLTDVQLDATGDPLTVRFPDRAGPSLADRVELLDATAARLVSAASMLPEDDPRPAEWTSELDSLISTGYTDADVEAATAALLAEAERLTTAVQLPEPFTFTLTGRSGTIEIRLTNFIDEPLDVLLRLESAKVNFPEGDQLVTLRPDGETSVVVPVEARSNGTSSINLAVATPLGVPLDEPVTLTSRVTALTGLGQVLTGGFVLVLLTWWFAHWRARRREDIVEGRDRHPSTGAVGSDAL